MIPEAVRALWRRANPPVIFERGSRNPLLVRLPYGEGNFDFLRAGSHRRPSWDPQFGAWELPRSWLDRIAERLVARWEGVWIVQRRYENLVCAPACWNAKGIDCVCSCGGENHGRGADPGVHWCVVSDTLAFARGEATYSARLMTPNLKQEEQKK